MKDELQLKLVEIISAIHHAVSKTGEFVAEQLPDIAQQYVVYGRVISAVGFIALLCLSAACFSLAWWAYHNPWFDRWGSSYHKPERSESNIAVIIFGAIIGTLSIMVSFLSFNYMVWVAPKVWLIKELASLIK